MRILNSYLATNVRKKREAESGAYLAPRGLEKLGFPWILSSESRVINGLQQIFSGRFFLALFCKRLLPESFPFEPCPSKSKSL
jgi:hypothetical protein